MLCHGITATRNFIVHGSVTLARSGHEQIAYDARAHGESDPAPEGGGYTYAELADDLEAVIAARVPDGPVVLAGASMGAHTVIARALRDLERISALVVITPVQTGTPPSEETLERWGRLADALESGGVDGFMDAFEAGYDADPAWKEAIMRFTRARMEQHRHPDAVADVMRQIARTQPFDSLDELESIELPTLVVADHDDADPLHPYAVAEAYAEKIPNARLVSEEKGESPLAWKGGLLSREIAEFIAGL